MKLKHTLIGIAGGLTLLAGTAHADSVSQDIQLRAVVPSGEFYVKPVNGWPSGVTSMNWNDANNKLDDIQIALRLKNNLNSGKEGKINASLAYPAVLSNGTTGDELPVEVTVSSDSVTSPVVLRTTAQAIYTNQTGGQENGLLKLHVTGTPKSGNTYNGVVPLIFESAV